MCIEVSRSPTTPAAARLPRAPGITAEGGQPHEQTGERETSPARPPAPPCHAAPHDAAPARARPTPRRVPATEAGIGANSAGSLAHRIEPPSGDAQREQRRRHRHHAHVHRHVRAEGLPRELRQRPEPHGGEREQSADQEDATHQ